MLLAREALPLRSARLEVVSDTTSHWGGGQLDYRVGVIDVPIRRHNTT